MIAALVPAAGRSSRMGRPKLILPIAGKTVIARVVSELRKGGAEPVFVVAPAAEIEGSSTIAAEARKQGAHVLTAPRPTADMRASIELGLAWMEQGPVPQAILLAPADSPGLTADLVSLLLEKARTSRAAILVPVFDGKRGHPIVLPWAVAVEIRRLPVGAGVNALLAEKRADVVEVEAADAAVLEDLDTPGDYEKYVSCEDG
jgi:molybdenum cofactor cytidylyltransferase